MRTILTPNPDIETRTRVQAISIYSKCKKTRVASLVMLIIGLLMSQFVSAQSLGTLDTSFNQSGKKLIHYNLGTVPPMGEGTEKGSVVYIYPDNSMLIGSYAKLTNEQDIDIGVTKLDSLGNIDTTFGVNGQVVVAFNNGGDFKDILNDILVYPDGRILLIGAAQSSTNDYDFALARLNSDGSMDSLFSNDGKHTIWFDDGGSNDDFAISAVLVPAFFSNRPDLIIGGNAQQTAGVDIALVKIDFFGAPLALNTRYNPDLSSTSADGLLSIVKSTASASEFWLLGYADEGFSSGTSPYLVKIDGDGSTLLSSQNFIYDFVAIDNRSSSWFSGVAKINGADKFAFVGGDSHSGVGLEDCAISFVNIESVDVNSRPVSAEFNFDINTLNALFNFNGPCTNASFTHSNQLILSGDLYPDDLSDSNMALFKLNSIDAISNGSGVSANSSIDTNFGFQGGMSIAFDTGGASTTNKDTTSTLKIGSDGNIIVVGSAMFDGSKERTTVAKVINSDIIFKNGFE